MAIIPEFYKDAVVALGIDGSDGKRHWVGTGFMVGRLEEGSTDRYTIYILTNKHVVEGFSSLLVRFNNAESVGVKDLEMPLIENGKKLYAEHPKEESDIVAIQILPGVIITNRLKLSFLKLEEHALTLEKMQRTGVDEGTLVYTLGFPMNLMNEKIKAPICRLGCISRIADAFVEPDKANDFLVDAEVFSGNSGGPVFNRPEVVSIEGTSCNGSCNLIGILSAYVPYRELLYSKQTDSVRMIQEENSGLTIVHPVDRIKEVVELEWRRHQIKQDNVQDREKAEV
ncbi:MAG: trypsin-like peptidase domain-containing protein [Lachnospiraceae bacterium]|nr:trypsin-like peptidase domain-containing protein [Lachnospiraceae bacterium]